MPELPEVETTCQGLRNKIIGCKIIKVEVRNYSLRKKVNKNIEQLINNRKINLVLRRGKYGIIKLSNNMNILFHLGMSGNIQVKKVNNTNIKKHDHIIIYLNSREKIIYNDTRRFGFFELIEDEYINNNIYLNKLGPEPLEKSFNYIYLKKEFKEKRTVIKNALMDQTLLAGLGNIYTCEALFMSKILPTRLCCDLEDKEIKLLVLAIKKVLRISIGVGGTSIQDYTSTSGKNGYFQIKLNVYGREDKICVKCNNKIKKIVQSQRSTYYCAKCQN